MGKSETGIGHAGTETGVGTGTMQNGTEVGQSGTGTRQIGTVRTGLGVGWGWPMEEQDWESAG